MGMDRHMNDQRIKVRNVSRGLVRRPWVSPRVSRMKATDAEAGPNPVNPEGLGFGS